MKTRRTARPCIRAALALAALAAAPLNAQSDEVGLDPARSVLLTNENLIFYTPQAGDLFGFALAAGDFDADGADDLATGIPLDDGRVSDPVADCGAVVVRDGTVGSPFDPDRAATTFLNQQQSGSPSAAAVGERHGRAVASGDFNGDGYADLAIGAPEDSHQPPGYAPSEGAVLIHYGSASGLALVAEHFHHDIDRFGYALAVGDFDGDAYDDLAVAVPFWSGGRVEVYHGGVGGLWSGASSYQIAQGLFAAYADVKEDGDRFGFALAAGDFDGSGHDDLAIGVPGEDGSGAVHVVFGSQWGLLDSNDVIYRQFDLGLSNGAGDDFGAALAAGDFDADGHADLAIGAPYRDVVRSLPSGDVTLVDAGWVTAIYGAIGGFDFLKTQQWSQSTLFPRFSTEDNDHFGFALAAADFDGDGHADLAIGVPGETAAAFTTGQFDGEVDVVAGSPSGLTALRRRAFSEGYQGLAGDAAQSHKHFGRALAAGDFDGDGRADLAIGVPYRNAGGIADVGAAIVVFGASQLPFADGFESGDTSRWSAAVP